MFEHFIHEVVITSRGTIILIDVAHTPDCGWEGAYSILNEEIFRKAWNEYDDENNSTYTLKDIMEYGEEAGAFDYWEFVSNHHRKPEPAEKNLFRAIAKL